MGPVGRRLRGERIFTLHSLQASHRLAGPRARSPLSSSSLQMAPSSGLWSPTRHFLGDSGSLRMLISGQAYLCLFSFIALPTPWELVSPIKFPPLNLDCVLTDARTNLAKVPSYE